MAFAAMFYGVPLIWLFIASTKDQVTLFSDPPFKLGTWENTVFTWRDLTTYNNFQILDWAKNSVIYSVGGVSVTLLTAIPAGYALAFFDFPGRKAFLIVTLIAMITPCQAIVLPIFLELLALNLNNTYLGLILAVGFFPFGVYLAYVFFSSALPKGVMDAARADGCNQFQLFLHVGLPLASQTRDRRQPWNYLASIALIIFRSWALKAAFRLLHCYNGFLAIGRNGLAAKSTNYWYKSGKEILMPRNTSVSLGDHFVGVIEQCLEKGRYNSASDVVRAGLRMLEEHETRVKSLQAALIEGEASGDAGPFNFEAFIAKQRPV